MKKAWPEGDLAGDAGEQVEPERGDRRRSRPGGERAASRPVAEEADERELVDDWQGNGSRNEQAET